jgi:hypothetical protein
MMSSKSNYGIGSRHMNDSNLDFSLRQFLFSMIKKHSSIGCSLSPVELVFVLTFCVQVNDEWIYDEWIGKQDNIVG